MDNFNELDEPVISSSGCKRKIKAETFHETLQKQQASSYNDEGKLCIITSIIYDHNNNNNNVYQASTLSSEEITNIKPVFLFNAKT